MHNNCGPSVYTVDSTVHYFAYNCNFFHFSLHLVKELVKSHKTVLVIIFLIKLQYGRRKNNAQRAKVIQLKQIEQLIDTIDKTNTSNRIGSTNRMSLVPRETYMTIYYNNE